MSINKFPPQEFTINGRTCNAHHITHTINGVPRWVLSLAEACNLLGIDYTKDNRARAERAIRDGVGGASYRGRWLPRAMVFQSHEIRRTLELIQETYRASL